MVLGESSCDVLKIMKILYPLLNAKHAEVSACMLFAPGLPVVANSEVHGNLR